MSFEGQVRNKQQKTDTTKRNRINAVTVANSPSTRKPEHYVPTPAQLSNNDDRKAEDEPNHKWKRWVGWPFAAFSLATEVTGCVVTNAYGFKPDNLVLGKVGVGFKLASNAQLWIKLAAKFFSGEMSYDDICGSIITAIHLSVHLADNIEISRYISQNTEMLEAVSKCAALFYASDALFFLSIIVYVFWAAYSIGSCISCCINRKKPATGYP